MTNQEYKAKYNRLTSALNKVKAILHEFETGKRPPENWNNTHDLTYRIENRIYQLNSDYMDYLSNAGKSYSFGNLTVIR